MNCDRALVALLDAELPGLVAGTTPLALHVRDCSRCRRVADQFIVDTHLLAMALPAPSSRRQRSIRTHVMAPLALAASLLVMVAVQEQGGTPASPVAAMLPPVVIAPSPVVARIEPVTPSTPRRAGREFPRTVPIAAVKLDGSVSLAVKPLEAIPNRTVSVTPPAGTRAVVMQTSDPKLVVVWLY
jgi:hypothetical protein